MECHWCKESMDESASVCPNCQKESLEITRLKGKCGIFFGIAFLILMIGLVSNTWHSGVSVFSEFRLANMFQSFIGWLFFIFLGLGIYYSSKISKLFGTSWWS